MQHEQLSVSRESVASQNADRQLFEDAYDNGEQYTASTTSALVLPDGTRCVRDPDGKTHLFRANRASEHYDEHGQLLHRWTVREDGTRVCVNAAGRVEVAESPDGRTRLFAYAPSGELSEISGYMGQWKRSRSEDGTLAWINQSTGKTWSGDFDVDANGVPRYRPRHKLA